MTEGRTFRLTLDTGYVGATHQDNVTVGDDEYETEAELEDILEDYARGMIANHVSCSWEEIT